ncbi:hypothetical protein LguiB_022714 [Lonicera macranthoides]
MDFWGSRVHSAKHLSAVQAARFNNSENYLIGNDTEQDDDARAWFPCPFCYVEVEISVLCRHLLEEHCFDLKNAVCPICAANLGKDPIEHFTVQHSYSVKRRRKSQVSGYNGSRMLAKDLGELSSFISPNWESGSRITNESVLDPLLSPFLSNITTPNDPKSNQDSEFSCSTASTVSDLESSEPSSSILDEAQEEDCQERKQRAAFVQQLLLSTIF